MSAPREDQHWSRLLREVESPSSEVLETSLNETLRLHNPYDLIPTFILSSVLFSVFIS